MPLNSWDMVHVPTVDHGTIEPTTLMGVGSALGVVSQAEAAFQDSLQNGTMNGWTTMSTATTQHYTPQETADMIFQHNASNTWQSIASLSPQQSNVDSSTPHTSTNSSMNTKTKKVKPAAYKPVTLTLTGQLKPSTLTKVPPVKSPRSTKSGSTMTAAQILAGNGW